ncbi:MAG: hypothetical protein IID32_03290 [Planctomycetes bacterium]|nr:hypothetical protein [Planctomycetota bacterium]
MRHASEPYEAYLSIYSPEGLLIERAHLGDIQPERRKFFDVSTLTRKLVPELDHLAVVHRIPSRLLTDVSSVEDEIELPELPDYSMFRALVEYSFPGAGNGGVIYETPPRLNARGSGRGPSNTFTFTCQVVLSEVINSHVVLINYSENPDYSAIASYNYALHSLSGETVWSDSVTIGPFGVAVLDLAQIIPEPLVSAERDPRDGLSTFGFVGYCDDAALLVLVVNSTPSLGAVALEHTHPPQGYLLPWDPGYRDTAKTDARKSWKSIMDAGRR